MAGVKRDRNGSSKPEQTSPFMPMFEVFRDNLDRHHDARERVIKASRDITAVSKKIIFALQRIRNLKEDIPSKIASDIQDKQKTVRNYFESIVPDVLGVNTWRYHPQISPGLQEFVEAVSLEHYLRNQSLISLEEAVELLPPGINLTADDYILGIFDLVGELMRFAITNMATTRKLPASKSGEGVDRDILADLRQLRRKFEELDTDSRSGTWLTKELPNKMNTMKESIQKVETAVCGLTIQGQERPIGWLPDSSENKGSMIEMY
ncbi:Translin-associated protein X [Erysiphe neolycopersici]|uniref:Translin-associated protein X n=1 Tax=Erysiphe neolycopersici TaxID=212602 RepID=A0A420HXB0_9PEZI|nr:Translin-associated protein X [Erysiphe neolycopersici]